MCFLPLLNLTLRPLVSNLNNAFVTYAALKVAGGGAYPSSEAQFAVAG